MRPIWKLPVFSLNRKPWFGCRQHSLSFAVLSIAHPRFGSPTKLVEYLALGLPVVANDHPEQRLILRPSRAGVCVPWGAQYFARGVLVDETQSGRACGDGARGRAWVEANRTYARIAADVERTYFAVLGSTARQEPSAKANTVASSSLRQEQTGVAGRDETQLLSSTKVCSWYMPAHSSMSQNSRTGVSSKRCRANSISKRFNRMKYEPLGGAALPSVGTARIRMSFRSRTRSIMSVSSPLMTLHPSRAF